MICIVIIRRGNFFYFELHCLFSTSRACFHLLLLSLIKRIFYVKQPQLRRTSCHTNFKGYLAMWLPKRVATVSPV